MSEQPDADVTLPVLWVGGEQLDVVKVNQFLMQVDAAGDLYLTVGTLTPPAIVAESPEEFAAAAAGIGYVPIRTVARLSLTTRNVAELVDVLQRSLENQHLTDRQTRGSQP